MHRRSRRLLIACAVLVIACIALGWVFTSLLDPIAIKRRIEGLASERLGYAVAIDGALGWQIAPFFGVTLHNVNVTARAPATARLCHIGALSVRLTWRSAWQAYRGQPLVVDRIALDNPDCTLIRYPDGVTNIGNWLSPAASSQGTSTLATTIDELVIDRGQLVWDDRQAHRQLTLRGIALRAGPLADRQKIDATFKSEIEASAFPFAPQLAGGLSLASTIVPDLAAHRHDIVVQGFTWQDRSTVGETKSISIVSRLSVATEPFTVAVAPLEATFEWTALGAGQATLDSVAWQDGRLVLKDFHATLKRGRYDAEVTFAEATLDANRLAVGKATLRSRNRNEEALTNLAADADLAYAMAGRTVEVNALSLSADVGYRNRLPVRLKGRAKIDVGAMEGQLRMSGTFDGARVAFNARMTHFTPPTAVFTARLASMDGSRVMRAFAAAGKAHSDTTPSAKFDATGTLTVGSLSFESLVARDAVLQVAWRDGVLLSPGLSH